MLELRQYACDVFLAEEVQRPEIMEDAIDFRRQIAGFHGVLHLASRRAPAAGHLYEEVVMMHQPG